MTETQLQALAEVEGWGELRECFPHYCENPRCWHETRERFCSSRCELSVRGDNYELAGEAWSEVWG